MEFSFSFKTTKKEKQEVNKQLTGRDSSQLNLPDDFVTTIASAINTGVLNSHLDLMLLYFNTVAEVNSLVTYIAQKGSDIPIKHVKILANGKQKDLGQTYLINLLNKPNFLNDGRTFKINCISSFFVYGFIPINKIKPIGWPDYSELFLFPGNQFFPIPEQSINQYGMPPMGIDFRLNKIKQYRLFIDAKPFNFDPSEIILINDSNLTFKNGAYLTGQSRLFSAIRSIQSLSNIYDTINSLIADKGAAGFLVKKAKANEVDSGWDEEDKKRVENKLYSYGTTNGKRPIGVSNKDLGFVRLSVPVNEFMPIELKDSEFRTLATALMFPAVLLNDKDGAIYNNVSLAQKAFYTDCLQPVVNQFYEALTNGLGLNELGEALIPDWSGIECLQEDKKLQAEIMTSVDTLWRTRYNNNICTLNEYLTAIGRPNLPNGNLYAKDSPEIPLINRIGLEGARVLQAIVSDANLTPTQKTNMIDALFGISKEQATLLIDTNVQ